MVTPNLEPTAYIKKGDLRPFLDVELQDVNSYPLNLSGSTVTFSMRVNGQVGGTPKLKDGACEILDAEKGQVRYVWQSADVDTANVFEGEFTITDEDGRKQTLPTDGFMLVVINDIVEAAS